MKSMARRECCTLFTKSRKGAFDAGKKLHSSNRGSIGAYTERSLVNREGTSRSRV